MEAKRRSAFFNPNPTLNVIDKMLGKGTERNETADFLWHSPLSNAQKLFISCILPDLGFPTDERDKSEILESSVKVLETRGDAEDYKRASIAFQLKMNEISENKKTNNLYKALQEAIKDYL